MRTASAFVSLAAAAVLAGCGGKPKPAAIGNEAKKPLVTEPWTVDRALSTIPPGTTAVIYADIDRLRESALLGSYYDGVKSMVTQRLSPACAQVSWTGKVVAIVGGERGAVTMTAFVVGADAPALRDCMTSAENAGGTEVTVDGDAIFYQDTRGSGAVQFPDDRSLVVHVTMGAGVVEVDRVALESATTIRSGEPYAELAQLRGSSAPVWALVSGSSAMLQDQSPMQFRVATVTADLDDDLAADVRVRFAKKDDATSLARTIQQQGQMAVGMGFLTKLDATADGDTVVVHVEATKASIDSLVQTLGSFGAGGGAGPFGPPPPPAP